MFKFFKSKLKKATNVLKRLSIGKKLKALFSKQIDENLFEDLEKLFYESDLGVEVSIALCDKLRSILQKDPDMKVDDIIKVLKEELLSQIVEFNEIEQKNPHVVMIVGVNGSGKTTSIAKIANHYKDEGNKVLLIAADTYRAAATEQLKLWADKIGIDIITSKQGADPSSVVFDGLEAAKARDIDVVLIDTAGRLHTKTNLMQELQKIKKVSNKVIDQSPHETILIVDATSGQNGVDGAKIFHSYTPISSIFLTKLDGSAKGGIVISIQKALKVPIKWIGIGEKADDIEPFDAEEFVEDLLSID